MKIYKRRFRIVKVSQTDYEAQITKWYYISWVPLEFQYKSTMRDRTRAGAYDFIVRVKEELDFKMVVVYISDC